MTTAKPKLIQAEGTSLQVGRTGQGHPETKVSIPVEKGLRIPGRGSATDGLFHVASPRHILNSSCSLSSRRVLTKELPTHSRTFP